MTDLRGSLIEGLLSLAKRFIETLFSLFKRHPARVALFVALLGGAILTGQVCARRIGQHQDVLLKTVVTEGEDTPQRFKVLEAIVMSMLPPNLIADIKRAVVSSELTERLAKIDASLRQHEREQAQRDAAEVDPKLAEQRPVAKPKSTVRLSIPNNPVARDALTQQSSIITDDEPLGYLFLPMNLLRQRIDNQLFTKIRDESLKTEPSPTLADIIGKEPIIADDIAASRHFLSFMNDAGSLELLEPNDGTERIGLSMRPIQTYYITKNGVARFVERTNAERDKLVLRNIYRATTHFPSRPYALQAMRRLKPYGLAGLSGSANDVFYVSNPYMDVAGAGIVVTLALPLAYPGHSDAVLCFDLAPLTARFITKQLKEQLATFGALFTEIDCNIHMEGSGDITCANADQSSDRDGLIQHQLVERLNRAMTKGDGLSSMIGDMAILPASVEPQPTWEAELDALLDHLITLVLQVQSTPLTFALPIGSTVARNDHEFDVHFFVCSLNVGRFQQVTLLLGLLSVLLLAFAVLIATVSWHDESRQRSALTSAMDAMDRGQSNSSTAYCRLNARDEIVDCNDAMLRLLGWDSEAALTNRSFENLLAVESRDGYRAIRELRKQLRPVPRYQVTFVTALGRKIEATITSGAIPSRIPGEPPHTFGFIVPVASGAAARASGVHQLNLEKPEAGDSHG